MRWDEIQLVGRSRAARAATTVPCGDSGGALDGVTMCASACAGIQRKLRCSIFYLKCDGCSASGTERTPYRVLGLCAVTVTYHNFQRARRDNGVAHKDLSDNA